MSLPSLAALSTLDAAQEPQTSQIAIFNELFINPRRLEQLTPHAPSGRYCLDNACDASSVLILRKAINASASETEELRAFMLDERKVPKTPNPMNRSTFVKRRQVTFGAKYNFGQRVASIGPDEAWPHVVRVALDFAKEFATSRGIAAELYNGVHTNFYPDGSAGVAPHSDAEGDMLRGLPIISITLLAGDPKPRPFSIYAKPDNKGATPPKLADVVLDHGDVIVMLGSMQSFFLHGVEAAKPPKAFKNAERLNMTVRAFTPDAVVSVGDKRPREGLVGM